MAEQKDGKPIEKIKGMALQAAHAETEPSHVRHYRAVLFQLVLLLVTGAFAVLTFLVKTTPFFSIDLQITKTLQSLNFPLFAGLMSLISWVGFFPQSLIITGLNILLIYGFGLHWEALMSLAAAVLVQGINVLVKDFIQRPRPAAALVHVFDTLSSYSFPSGHVMFYTGFFGFIWFLAFTLLKISWKRTLLLVIFGSLVLTIGVSRIYLGEHWASDVVGAYLLGSLVLIGVIQFYRWGKTRFFIHQPVAAGSNQDGT